MTRSFENPVILTPPVEIGIRQSSVALALILSQFRPASTNLDRWDFETLGLPAAQALSHSSNYFYYG